MNIGKMREVIEIIEPKVVTDKYGFSKREDVTIGKSRAYREGRHGSKLWANMAAFSSATELFRFRKIPNIDITTDMIIVTNNHRFSITSVEDIKGKGMYIEVLANEVKPSGKSSV